MVQTPLTHKTDGHGHGVPNQIRQFNRPQVCRTTTETQIKPVIAQTYITRAETTKPQKHDYGTSDEDLIDLSSAQTMQHRGTYESGMLNEVKK